MKVFIEEQRFTQVWVYIILAVSFIVPLLLITTEWLRSDGNDNESTIGFIVLVITILLTFGLIFSLKLKTRIDEIGIHYRFIPFHFSSKLIPWNDINKAYVRKYKAISEYGGWGIKGRKLLHKSRGLAYNMKGNMGLQLELKNGNKILIGTQKQDNLKRVLQNYEERISFGNY